MNINTITTTFHFIRPAYLYLLGLIVLIYIIKKIYAYIKSNNHSPFKTNVSDNWGQLCQAQILNYLYLKNNNTTKSKHPLLLAIITVLTIIALAGPTWSKHEIPLYQNKNSWIIALSLSETMLKTDITPSRLQRAKYKIQDFLNYLHDEQLALIVFSDKAFNLIPLTTDKKTVTHILPSVDPLIMPVSGNNIDAALTNSLDIIHNLKLKNTNLLILTDSNANSASLITAKKFHDIPIHIINFNISKDNNFNNSLNELSTLSQGLYQNVSNNDEDLKNIINKANAAYQLSQQFELAKNLSNTAVWHDMGPYLLLLILPLLLVYLFRTHALSIRQFNSISFCFLIVLAALLHPTHNIFAANNYWSKLWFNQQQLSAADLANPASTNQIDPKVFSSSKWQAAALYRNKQYDKSATLLANDSDITSQYNYANSLAQQGNVQEAINNYNKVLQANPNHPDAKYNKDLLENYLKQQNKQNQNSNQNQNNNQQDQNKNNPDNQNNQSAENSNSSKQDKNNSQKEQESHKPNDPKPDLNKNKTESTQAQKDQPEQQQQTSQQQSKTDKETQQWLNKIPDNPAIYLRNQLQYEYWKEQQ